MTTGTIQPHAAHAAFLDGENGEELAFVYRLRLQQLTVLPVVRLIDLPVFTAGAVSGGTSRRMPAVRIGCIWLLVIAAILAVVSDGWLLVDQVGNFLAAASAQMTPCPVLANVIHHAARLCPARIVEAPSAAFIGWSLLVCTIQEVVLFVGRPYRLPRWATRAIRTGGARRRRDTALLELIPAC